MDDDDDDGDDDGGDGGGGDGGGDGGDGQVFIHSWNDQPIIMYKTALSLLRNKSNLWIFKRSSAMFRGRS